MYVANKMPKLISKNNKNRAFCCRLSSGFTVSVFSLLEDLLSTQRIKMDVCVNASYWLKRPKSAITKIYPQFNKIVSPTEKRFNWILHTALHYVIFTRTLHACILHGPPTWVQLRRERERERLCRRRQRFHFALLCGIGTVRQFFKKKCKFIIHIFFFF